MAGAGNDFIVIEAQKGLNLKRLALKVCDRTNGIGADGVLVLDKSKKSDYRMRIINADGSEAEMCGNGARCMVAYIVANKKLKKKLFSMETLAGEILGEVQGEVANIRLSEPRDYKASIPLTINKRKINVSYIDTGVPHVVVAVSGLGNIDVQKIGNLIRFHTKFKPRGANVNFVEQIKANLVNARTYERGVEGETKACGTGSVASAIMMYLKMNLSIMNKKNSKMKVCTASGEILDITFDINDGKPSNVWLKGSAKFIAKGEYYV
ncbi:Diaminopimelate epimerase [hydrothermal vent metagenome]|uniref:diaminopimelate epimerase n=1 Tax=hydrothermal vent metagenome TaxID=652676 RepID=A0A3B1E0M9_9ZZZZ